MVSRRKATVLWHNCRTCASRKRREVEPTTGSAHTTGVNEEEDAGSSVSEVTAVGIGLRADLGTRMQARARELEDEVYRFCADSANRITVSARNYIMTRLFELVSLCSDMRADAATERGAALALQGQLVDARRGDRRPAEAGVGCRTTPRSETSWVAWQRFLLLALQLPCFLGGLAPRWRWVPSRWVRRFSVARPTLQWSGRAGRLVPLVLGRLALLSEWLLA
ncbi:hypothetical protein MTO96_046713 [Rhipicephalus appendiculatus]